MWIRTTIGLLFVEVEQTSQSLWIPKNTPKTKISTATNLGNQLKVK